MKQKLNEFLMFGLDPIKPSQRKVYGDRVNYIGNSKSDFPGKGFYSITEAKEYWRKKKNLNKKLEESRLR